MTMMFRKEVLIFAIILVGGQARGDDATSDIFHEVWNTAKENIYPPVLVETHFTPHHYEELRRQANQATSLY